jgi:hypothetical protein
MPNAIGRSKRPDSFGRSAGARLTVQANGEIETAILECGAHPLAAFTNFEIGQADD